MNNNIHPIASLLAAVARGISGVQVQWAGCQPDERQRIYFANHSSHLDFVVLWSALPSKFRAGRALSPQKIIGKQHRCVVTWHSLPRGIP